MVSTVGNLVDRLFREYLHPADDQPTTTTLVDAVTDSVTTWTYDAGLLAADEQELLVPGVLVEAGQELALITDADHTAGTLTVRRGMAGTTAAAHDAGALVQLAPVFPRRAAFDAVADNIVRLYPRLFAVKTTALTSANGVIDAPADMVTPISFQYLYGSHVYDAEVQLFRNYAGSATGRALHLFGVSAGRDGWLTYRAQFTRPTDEADLVEDDLGVRPEWEGIVLAGAAAQLLTVREFDSVNTEFITEQMRGEGYPPGTASRQRDALLRLYQFLLDNAARSLIAETTVPVTVNRTFPPAYPRAQ